MQMLRTMRNLVGSLVLVALAGPVWADGRADLDAALEALDRGNMKAAVEAASKVAEGDPWRADAQFALGYAHAVTNDHANAVKAYREVVRLRPDDARALADGIRRLAEDDALRETLAKRSLERAGEHTWDARATRMLAALEAKAGAPA